MGGGGNGEKGEEKESEKSDIGSEVVLGVRAGLRMSVPRTDGADIQRDSCRLTLKGLLVTSPLELLPIYVPDFP